MLITWELIILGATWVLGWAITGVMLAGKVRSQRFWFRIVMILVVMHLAMQVELLNFLKEPANQWIGYVLSIPFFALLLFSLFKSGKAKTKINDK